MVDYDPPQGFIKIWDSNSGLFGNYVTVSDWEGNRQNGECSGGRDHPVIFPRRIRESVEDIPEIDFE